MWPLQWKKAQWRWARVICPWSLENNSEKTTLAQNKEAGCFSKQLSRSVFQLVQIFLLEFIKWVWSVMFPYQYYVENSMSPACKIKSDTCVLIRTGLLFCSSLCWSDQGCSPESSKQPHSQALLHLRGFFPYFLLMDKQFSSIKVFFHLLQFYCFYILGLILALDSKPLVSQQHPSHCFFASLAHIQVLILLQLL